MEINKKFEKLFGKEPADGSVKFYSLSVHIQSENIFIQWGAEGIGFGQAVFHFDKKKGFWIDTEHMGKDFFKAMITEIERRQKKKELVIERTEIVYKPEYDELQVPNTDFPNPSFVVPLLWTFYYHGRYDYEMRGKVR